MKIFRRTLIYAMSMERDNAKTRVKGFSDVLPEHIIKCVVYGNTTNDLHHWVCVEICDFLSIVNDITVRPHDKKLKPKDIRSWLFGAMGDSRNEASILLRTFNLKNKRTKEYPDFDVTEVMIDTVYYAFRTIISDTLPILTTKNNLKKEDFIPYVCKALQIDVDAVM